MDLESYISRYSGPTALHRLLLIAQTTPDETLAQQAFDLAEEQMKMDGNVRKYKEIFEHVVCASGTPAGSSSGEQPEEHRPPHQQQQLEETAIITPSSSARSNGLYFGPLCRKHPSSSKPLDINWMKEAELSNQVTRQTLVGRLSTAQSHLHKEAIRAAYIALANHDLQTGFENEAMGSYMRAAEYCTNRVQTAELSLLTLQVAFCTGNFQYVKDYSKRLELTFGNASATGSSPAAVPGGLSSPSRYSNDFMKSVQTKLEIAQGIERMVSENYTEAAEILIPLVMQAKSSSSSNNKSSETEAAKLTLDWPGVISSEDLALYASLMCLVTVSPNNRSRMVTLADHPEALELVPHMKEMLLQRSRSNYGPCMQAFGVSDTAYVPQVLPMGVDLYLTPPRFQILARQIREMCLVEYLRPYQCVKLESMQQLFPSLGPNLMDVLVDLMSRRLLPPTTRLDCRAGVIFQTEPHPNPTRQIQVMEEKVMDDVHAMLVRLACLESDLVVRDPTMGQIGRGGRSRARRGARGGGGAFVPIAGGDSDEDEVKDDSDDDNMMGEVDVETHHHDTPMMDADALMAMNPEDMY